MSHAFAVQLCRLEAPEKLSDRFLASGILLQKEGLFIGDQVLLAYLFEVTKPWFPSSRVLPTLLDTLYDQHRYLQPGSTLGDQFEHLLKVVNSQLGALSETGETDWIGNLNGMIMAISGDQLHFSQTGRCPAYLLQSNRIRQITDDPVGDMEPHPLKTFSNLASGALKEDDQVLFGNPELYREISLDALRRILKSATPYQSCLTIAKELKKEKNPAVTSVIIKVTSRSEAENKGVAEPLAVLLEEQMQSGLHKFGKQLLPVLQQAQKLGVQVGQSGLAAAQQTGQLVKEKVAPKAGELLQKGMEQARNLTTKTASTQASPGGEGETPPEPEAEPPILPTPVVAAETPAEPTAVPETIATLQATPLSSKEPVVEIITPRAHRHSPSLPNPLSGLVNRLQQQKFPSLPTPRLESARRWLRPARNQKIAAAVLATCLILVAIWNVSTRRHTGSAGTAAGTSNQELLAQAKDLAKQSATAIQLQQQVEATRELGDAQRVLGSISNPSDSQRQEVDSVWKEVNTQADSLTNTTRLGDPDNRFKLSSPADNVVSSPAYFFAQTDGGQLASVARSGGNPVVSALPDQADSIVSLAISDQQDTAAFAFTRKNKLYRVLQSGSSTSLRPLTPQGGDFVAGDALASYLGNLYVLDGKSGLLWKYATTGTAYNKPTSMLDSTKFDIKGGISLAVDGSIYVLKNDGSLLRFTHGNQDDFALKGLPKLSEKMQTPAQVITSSDMQSIYILDRGLTSGDRSTAKVFEFTKNGTYVRQYAFPAEYTKVMGFSINLQERKLWVVNGDEISEFSI